jgi:hypothetical protein
MEGLFVLDPIVAPHISPINHIVAWSHLVDVEWHVRVSRSNSTKITNMSREGDSLITIDFEQLLKQ